MRNSSALVLGTLLAGLAVAPRALACGGCFTPPQPTTVDTVVTGHRMAFAISDERTVLWDQIRYSGNPSDFGWVLPVAPGAVLELSSDAFFEALETATATQVAAPQLQCAVGASGDTFGCSAPAGDNGAPTNSSGGFLGGPSVTVLREQSIGPYETVTLSSDDSGALRAW